MCGGAGARLSVFLLSSSAHPPLNSTALLLPVNKSTPAVPGALSEAVTLRYLIVALSCLEETVTSEACLHLVP